jgi:hypothetical protein
VRGAGVSAVTLFGVLRKAFSGEIIPAEKRLFSWRCRATYLTIETLNDLARDGASV